MPHVADAAARARALAGRAASEFRRRGAIRAAAQRVARAPAPTFAVTVCDQTRARSTMRRGRVRRNNDIADAVGLQRSAGANLLDSEVAGNLAFCV